MKTATNKTDDLLTYERVSPYGYYAISIDGEKIAHAYESDLATAEENAKWICKRVNHYEALLNALKKIMDSAENKKVEFFTFDKWCDDIKETIKNA